MYKFPQKKLSENNQRLHVDLAWLNHILTLLRCRHLPPFFMLSLKTKAE